MHDIETRGRATSIVLLTAISVGGATAGASVRDLLYELISPDELDLSLPGGSKLFLERGKPLNDELLQACGREEETQGVQGCFSSTLEYLMQQSGFDIRPVARHAIVLRQFSALVLEDHRPARAPHSPEMRDRKNQDGGLQSGYVVEDVLCGPLIQALLVDADASELRMLARNETDAASPHRALLVAQRLCAARLARSEGIPVGHFRRWDSAAMTGVTEEHLFEIDKAVLEVLQLPLEESHAGLLMYREFHAVKLYRATEMQRLHLRRFGPITDNRRRELDVAALRLVQQDASRTPPFDIAAKAQEFEATGWALLPDLISSAAADALYDLTMHLLHADLHVHLTGTPTSQYMNYKGSGQPSLHLVDLLAGCRFPQVCAMLQTNFRVLPLLSRGEAYAAVMQHPTVKDVMRRLLGAEYMISGYTSYVVGSGSAGGNFHQDGRVHDQIRGAVKRCLPSRHRCVERDPNSTANLMVSALVYLYDIAIENGATKFVRGSHMWSADEHAAFGLKVAEHGTVDGLDVDVAPGSKGSVLLLNAAIWHASGAYAGGPHGKPRATLVMAFAPPFQDNLELFLGIDGGSDYWARTWLGHSSIWSVRNASLK